MAEPKYRWAYPSDWLDGYIDQARGDATKLYALCNELARELAKLGGEDAIQDLFQPDMDADHYFDPVNIYQCGGCGAYHPCGFDGDCRDDDHRYGGPEDYADRVGLDPADVCVEPEGRG